MTKNKHSRRARNRADTANAGRLDEQILGIYRNAAAESSCQAHQRHQYSLWTDIRFLERSGEPAQCRRLRKFAPIWAITTVSRAAASDLDLSLKVGLAQLARPEPGSIAAVMIEAAIDIERHERDWTTRDVEIHVPEMDAPRPGIRERTLNYGARRLVASPMPFLAEARRHIAHLPALMVTDAWAAIGCREMAIDCTLMACAVPSRSRAELQAKSQLIVDVMPMTSDRRILAKPMLVAAAQVEGMRWGVPADFISGAARSPGH